MSDAQERCGWVQVGPARPWDNGIWVAPEDVPEPEENAAGRPPDPPLPRCSLLPGHGGDHRPPRRHG